MSESELPNAKIGRRPIYVIGFLWLGAALAIFPVAQNLTQLVGTQFLLNIGFDRGHETLQASNVFASSSRYARQALGPDNNQRDDADQAAENEYRKPDDDVSGRSVPCHVR